MSNHIGLWVFLNNSQLTMKTRNQAIGSNFFKILIKIQVHRRNQIHQMMISNHFIHLTLNWFMRIIKCQKITKVKHQKNKSMTRKNSRIMTNSIISLKTLKLIFQNNWKIYCTEMKMRKWSCTEKNQMMK